MWKLLQVAEQIGAESCTQIRVRLILSGADMWSANALTCERLAGFRHVSITFSVVVDPNHLGYYGDRVVSAMEHQLPILFSSHDLNS